jgi:FkbM family methyltransferase
VVDLSILFRRETARALRTDPLRMIVRRVMQPIENRMNRRRGARWVDRRYGNDMVLRYRLSEVLSPGRYLYGCHEYAATSVFKALLRTGAIVADIGANLGEYSIVAGHAAGPAGRVIAVEPNPTVRERFERNVQLNALTNVTIVAAAFSDANGKAELHVPDGDWGLGTLDPRATGDVFTVPTRTLDDVMTELALPGLDVIKMDVEGHEVSVLRGGTRTLVAHHPAVLYEASAETLIWNGPRWYSSASELLVHEGYHIFGIVPNRRGFWRLERVDWTRNPLGRYRMPWETLSLVALHPASPLYAIRDGAPAWPACGVFEVLSTRGAPERSAAAMSRDTIHRPPESSSRGPLP